MTIYRPGHHLVIPGARVLQPGGAAAPWWMAAGVTPAAVYQAKGAASYAASKVNLANPGTYDAIEGVAPVWNAATGWEGDGTRWLAIPDLFYGSLTSTVLLRITNSTSNWSYFFSAIRSGPEATAVNFASFVDIHTTRVRVGNSAWANITAQQTDMVIGVAGITPYLNGVALPDIAGAAAVTSSRSAIGANWPGYGPFSPFHGIIATVVVYFSVLNATEVAAETAAMAAL